MKTASIVFLAILFAPVCSRAEISSSQPLSSIYAEWGGVRLMD